MKILNTKIFCVVFLLIAVGIAVHISKSKDVTSFSESSSEPSITDIKQWAKEGVPEIQTHLGILYLNGHPELQKDEDEGMYWLITAANKKCILAQEYLASYFKDKKDYKKMKRWRLQSAKQGSGEAMLSLASYSALIEIGEVDMTECIKWLLLSASSGVAEAKEWLGKMDYKHQIFKTKDFFDAYNLAQRWIEIYHPPRIALDVEYTIKYEQLLQIIPKQEEKSDVNRFD